MAWPKVLTSRHTRLAGADEKFAVAVAAGNRRVKPGGHGQAERFAGLAQALLGQRELLVLDEPTNGLDPAGINEMRQFIRRMPAEFGITVFLSSRLLSEVEHVATHVGILSQGALVFQGSASDIDSLRRPRQPVVSRRAPRASHRRRVRVA